MLDSKTKQGRLRDKQVNQSQQTCPDLSAVSRVVFGYWWSLIWVVGVLCIGSCCRHTYTCCRLARLCTHPHTHTHKYFLVGCEPSIHLKIDITASSNEQFRDGRMPIYGRTEQVFGHLMKKTEHFFSHWLIGLRAETHRVMAQTELSLKVHTQPSADLKALSAAGGRM